MPQLDLAIFSFHVVIFCFCFFLMYIYIRGSFVPYLSSIIKYRKKLFNYFLVQKIFFQDKLYSLNSLLEVKVVFILTSYFRFALKFFFLTNIILAYWTVYFNKIFLLNKHNALLDFYYINWYLINNYGEK